MVARRVAKIIRACQELPGQELLQYLDEQQELRAVSSGDVNYYLRTITGADITAKDFRTWAGTVLAARFLKEAGGSESVAEARRKLSAAVKRVAAALGNTPAVCRKSYIHPLLCSAYLDGGLNLDSGAEGRTSGLRPKVKDLFELKHGPRAGSPRGFSASGRWTSRAGPEGDRGSGVGRHRRPDPFASSPSTDPPRRPQ